jgi:hypothetical protein
MQAQVISRWDLHIGLHNETLLPQGHLPTVYCKGYSRIRNSCTGVVTEMAPSPLRHAKGL